MRFTAGIILCCALFGFAQDDPIREEVGQDKQETVSETEPDATTDVQPIAEGEALPSAQPVVAETTVWQPTVDYDLVVTLDPKEKKLYGEETLLYTNHSPDIIGDLQFHMYLNASSNNRSTYFRELGELNGPQERLDEDWGYVHMIRARIDGVEAGDLRYIQAEDAAAGDRTVLQIPLAEPLLPGQTVKIELEFNAKLPRAWDRVGYVDNFFIAVQWFPKIAVWETQGFRGAETSGWNCHSFHRFTEFYADYGSYRVEIVTPRDYVVGATGNRISKQDRSDGTHHVYRQDRVHDFAFVASPDLREVVEVFNPTDHVSEEEIQQAMVLHGLAREDVALEPVEITFLYQAAHEDQVRRHLDALSLGLKHFGLWYGRYPYKTITMVDPPYGGAFAGAMEYPTLITIGTNYINPERDRDLEDLIIHEFGHQYWYGLVGSNEFEEAWLDEGFNTYSTGKILDKVWGPTPVFGEGLGIPAEVWSMVLPTVSMAKMPEVLAPDMRDPQPGVRLSVSDLLAFKPTTFAERARAQALAERGRDHIRKKGWKYVDEVGYWANSYQKPATLLNQLEREIGEDVMARVMRTWFNEGRFQHPDTDDFIAIVERVSGRPMAWFFDELMGKTGFLDYEVDPNIKTLSYNDGVGYVDHGAGPELQVAVEGAEPTLTTYQVVMVRNAGTLRYPLEVAVYFDDGTSVLETWDGAYPWRKFRFEGSARIEKVVLDPQGKILIDANRANNSYVVKPDPRASRRWSVRLLFAVQNLLQGLAGGI